MFYRPYDPMCPDRKRDEECLEINYDTTPPAIEEEGTTQSLS